MFQQQEETNSSANTNELKAVGEQEIHRETQRNTEKFTEKHLMVDTLITKENGNFRVEVSGGAPYPSDPT